MKNHVGAIGNKDLFCCERKGKKCKICEVNSKHSCNSKFELKDMV